MFGLWGWNAQSATESSEDDAQARHQQQYEAYTQHQRNKPPKKPKNSGGSAGIMRTSKSNKVKAFLGVDVDDEFTGKINDKFRYRDPKPIEDPSRILDQQQPDTGDPPGQNRINSKDNGKSRHTPATMTNRNNLPKSRNPTEPASPTDEFKPKRGTKVSFDSIKAAHNRFENEEDEVLSDMSQILSRLSTNSNAIQTSLRHQTGLLDETKRLTNEQLGTFAKLEETMEQIIQRSSCSHYSIILIELIIILVLFFALTL